MATISVGSIPLQRSILKRPPLRLTAQRLEANRRNAARSTGARSVKEKARVARNAIKHGFFADAQRWSEQQHRDFAQLFAGLCADFRLQSERDETSVAVVADCYVRMAAVWRYESIAALKEHQRAEREMNQRIATATPSEAARLDHREELRRAGLWRPTIPGPREAAAIIRYEGRLHRAIRTAIADLERNGMRNPHGSRRLPAARSKSQKQTHLSEENRDLFQFADRIFRQSARIFRQQSSNRGKPVAPGAEIAIERKSEKPSAGEIAKTNPLSSMFSGNRHARRRAKALARRRQ